MCFCLGRQCLHSKIKYNFLGNQGKWCVTSYLCAGNLCRCRVTVCKLPKWQEPWNARPELRLGGGCLESLVGTDQRLAKDLSNLLLILMGHVLVLEDVPRQFKVPVHSHPKMLSQSHVHLYNSSKEKRISFQHMPFPGATWMPPSSSFWWAFSNSPAIIWGHRRKVQSLVPYLNCSGKLTQEKKNLQEMKRLYWSSLIKSKSLCSIRLSHCAAGLGSW